MHLFTYSLIRSFFRSIALLLARSLVPCSFVCLFDTFVADSIVRSPSFLFFRATVIGFLAIILRHKF